MHANTSPRSNGLDTLRALALLLVLMYHYMVFVSHEETFGWLSVVGWVGVDLFFVLSGYLIGNQIFAGMVRREKLSLTAFYVRRGLRTWPLFWVIVAAYFIFPDAMGGKTPPPLWRFLTFTQNFQLQPGTAFSHAWSLCIEEQFYLVLPLVVLAALRWGTRRYQAWMLLLTLLAIGIVARAVMWMQFGREDFGDIKSYYPNVYYGSLGRFDEFLPGIAVALVKNFHPQGWAWVQRNGGRVFALGCAAVVAALYGVYNYFSVDGEGYLFFMTVFGYSLVALAFSMLLASALIGGSPLMRLRIPGVPQLALWSYSIYLSHKAVFMAMERYSKQVAMDPSLRLVLVAALSVALGAFLYRFVELPFMNLRDRRYPSLHLRPAAA